MEDKAYIIKTAIKTRMIDLSAIAGIAGNKECEEYYRIKRGRRSIDISLAKDDRVAETITYAVYDYFKKNFSTQYSIAIVGQGFLRFFENDPELFSMDFPEFSKAVGSMDLHCKPVPLMTVKKLILVSCMRIVCNGDMYASDYWDLQDIPMSPDRRNPSSVHNTMDFSAITNESDKSLLKQYIKHLLLETHGSVITILSKQQRLRRILNTVPEPFVSWGEAEMELLIESSRRIHTKRRSIAEDIRIIEHFAQYFVEKDIIKENIVLPFHSLTLGFQQEFRETDRDTYIIAQIFNVLDDMKDPYAEIWFLLLFTTGMRNSEASQLRRDCLEADGKGRYFIRFYNQKMKKDVTNQIPKRLYDMIVRHISSLSDDSGYLFPSYRKRGYPIQSQSMSSIINREFHRLGVKNVDGTPYVFKPHDLRHWVAKRMYEAEVPVQFIQEQLHHATPEMTMSYVEFQDKAKAKKMKQYISSNKDAMSVSKNHEPFSEADYAQYAQKKMALRALPNGMCARPKVLGRCSTMDSCLKCADFRTEAKDLPKHREHLRNLNAFIESAEKYGWNEQAEESREIRKRLLDIIHGLEGGN